MANGLLVVSPLHAAIPVRDHSRRGADDRPAHGVIKAPSGERATYGALVGGKSFSITLDPKKPVPTKDPKDLAPVGKPVQRLDIPDKVTGRFTYMQDFRLPDMLQGRVVRPPAVDA
jgi:nicotinate dehydrogenase subunit B